MAPTALLLPERAVPFNVLSLGGEIGRYIVVELALVTISALQEALCQDV